MKHPDLLDGIASEAPRFSPTPHIGGLVGVGFAGGGGSSLGLKWAGLDIDFAMNHDAAAIAMHTANCPEAHHYCQDIWQVHPTTVRPGEPIRFMWFSPDCTHFSKAKGGAPVEKKIRDLAWVIVLWAKLRRPDVIAMENVEEFVTWGPLMEDPRNPGKLIPDPKRKGEYFEAFKAEFRRLGYTIAFKEIRAFAHGTPTIRKRLFGQFRCDGQPISWPEPTHGDPSTPAVRAGKLLPWRTIAECIEWERPCPSIFLTRAEARKVRANRPLADPTMARITLGLQRYVLEAERAYIVPITHRNGGNRAHSVEEPGRTQTTSKGGEHALVVPHITHFHGGRVGQPVTAPGPAMTANSYHKRPGGAAPVGLASAYLASAGGAEYAGKPRALDEPINAMLTDNRKTLVAATMIQTGYGERDGQEPRTKDLHQPGGTEVAGGAKLAPVAVYMAQHNSGVVGHSVAEPMSTLLTAGCHQHAVAAQLAHLRGSGQRFGNALDEPGPTDTAGGLHLAVSAACLVKYYSSAEHGQAAGEPLHALTTKARFGLVMVDMAATGLTEEQRYTAWWVARMIDVWGHPGGLPAKGKRRRKGVGSLSRRTIAEQIDRDLTPRPAAVGRDGWIVWDIGMRMLSVRERYRAQGVPDDFTIDVAVDGKPITATKQGEMCGNMVCPQVSEAIARAALPELAAERTRTAA